MTLDLSPYRVDTPYPDIQQVKKDADTAALLMDGYCGAVSELTTVLQYAYHSLRCKNKFGEISQTMRGIFYVETMHMELLGNCVQRLGMVPHYTLQLQNKMMNWQSSLVLYEATPSAMLQADIEGEKQAVAYYRETAEKVQQPDIKKLLLRLAEDEEYHVKLLTDLYRRHYR